MRHREYAAITGVGRRRVRGGWPFIDPRLGRPELKIPPEAKPPDEVELADGHRPGRGPQAVEHMSGLLDPANEAARLTLNIKNAMNPDVERARGVHLRVVQESVVVAHAEAVPPPTVTGFVAQELPL